MSVDGETGKRPARRRPPKRQRRVPGGRPNQIYVKLSDRELAIAKARAHRLKVTLPRLAAEAMLSGSFQSVTERTALFEELMALRRLASALGNNINQLARAANSTGELPEQTAAAAQAVERLVSRTDAALDAIEGLIR